MTASHTALRAWRSILGQSTIRPLPRASHPLWQVTGEDGRAFVLKCLPEYSPGVTPVEEFRVLGHLQAAGVPVVPPIVTDAGSIHATVDDRRYALLAFIASDAHDHELGEDAAPTSRAIGAGIARLGLALRDCPWPVSSFTDDPVAQILDAALAELPEEARRPVLPLVDRLRSAAVDLPTQRTHGDCNTGNVLVHRGRVSAIIDLDHLPTGPRVRDLAYYLASRVHTRFREPETAEAALATAAGLLGAYVDGYHRTAPLSDRELAAVVPLMLLVELGGAHWSLHGWEPNLEHYRRNLAAIRWITGRFDELVAAAARPVG